MLPGEVCFFEACFSGGERRTDDRMEMLKSGASKVVGTRQVLRALKAGRLSRAYVGNDADTYIYQQVVRAAEEAGVPCVRVATMKELGMLCGVAVPAAAAGVLR